jgi:hypothetical protein
LALGWTILKRKEKVGIIRFGALMKKKDDLKICSYILMRDLFAIFMCLR